MAEKKNICIDEHGNEVFKFLPQCNNVNKIILDLFRINNYKIERKEINNGCLELAISKNGSKKIKLVNIFFANYKFDSQRPRWININLGTNIKNPFLIKKETFDIATTLVLGVYVFNPNDSIENTIIVNCPIKDRNYNANPSLRVKIDVIKEARLRGKYTWYNNANDPFTAFKPLEFDKIFFEPINSFDLKNFKNIKNTQDFTDTRLSKGPAPRSKGYTISIANPEIGEAYTYVAQFGKENIFKIGYTVDFERRVKEFNQYIPKFEKSNLDTWSIIWTKKKENKREAFDLEQNLFKKLYKFRTSKEFLVCNFKKINEVIKSI